MQKKVKNQKKRIVFRKRWEMIRVFFIISLMLLSVFRGRAYVEAAGDLTAAELSQLDLDYSNPVWEYLLSEAGPYVEMTSMCKTSDGCFVFAACYFVNYKDILDVLGGSGDINTVPSFWRNYEDRECTLIQKVDPAGQVLWSTVTEQGSRVPLVFERGDGKIGVIAQGYIALDAQNGRSCE